MSCLKQLSSMFLLMLVFFFFFIVISQLLIQRRMVTLAFIIFALLLEIVSFGVQFLSVKVYVFQNSLCSGSSISTRKGPGVVILCYPIDGRSKKGGLKFLCGECTHYFDVFSVKHWFFFGDLQSHGYFLLLRRKAILSINFLVLFFLQYAWLVDMESPFSECWVLCLCFKKQRLKKYFYV